MQAAVEVAAALGCSLSELADKLPVKELPLWLAHFGNKLGYTFDTEEIRKIEVERFQQQMREHCGGLPGGR